MVFGLYGMYVMYALYVIHIHMAYMSYGSNTVSMAGIGVYQRHKDKLALCSVLVQIGSDLVYRLWFNDNIMILKILVLIWLFSISILEIIVHLFPEG